MKDKLFLETIVLMPIVHIIYECESLVDSLNAANLLDFDEINRFNLEIDYEIAALNGARFIVNRQGISERLLYETINTLQHLYSATTTITGAFRRKHPVPMIEHNLCHLISIIRTICSDNDLNYAWLRREVEENE